MFRIGQKVAFIGIVRSFHQWSHLPAASLKIGSVYTVRNLEPAWIPLFGFPGLRIEEDVFEPVQWMGRLIEPSHPHFRFRPVIERKAETGMAILREILDRESYQDRVPERVRG